MIIFDFHYTTLDISVFDHCYDRKSVHGGLHRQELVQYFVLFQVKTSYFRPNPECTSILQKVTAQTYITGVLIQILGL